VIVDCALYHAGAREEVGDFSDALDRARAIDDAFVWIGLYEPSEEEFAHITSEFDLHPLAVEDAVKAHQRPKLDIYGDTLFMVVKTIRYIDSTELVETGEIAIFLGPGFIVSVRHGEARPLTDVRHRLEGSDTLVKCGASAVLHAIADAVVDDYLAVSVELELDIDQIEEQVFGGGRENHAERAYRLKRETLEFKRAALPLTPVLDRLAKGQVPNVHVEATAFFKDVLDHNLRAS
jgi:magnesium transporter